MSRSNHDYDKADGEDDANAMSSAINALKGKEFEENDLKFYFKQVEIKMKGAGVKKNFTKLEVLSSILPTRVINEVKPILRKEEDEFPNKDAYFQLKNEIKRIFGPSQASHYQRAMSRVLTGKPSQLCRALINDMCDTELTNCCCHKWVFGKWHEALPSSVKQAVAHHSFNKDTMRDVLQLADNVFESTRPAANVAAAQVAALEDTAFHQDFPSEGQAAAAEVAAIVSSLPL